MKASEITCPVCKAPPNQPCTRTLFLGASHWERLKKAGER